MAYSQRKPEVDHQPGDPVNQHQPPVISTQPPPPETSLTQKLWTSGWSMFGWLLPGGAAAEPLDLQNINAVALQLHRSPTDRRIYCPSSSHGQLAQLWTASRLTRPQSSSPICVRPDPRYPRPESHLQSRRALRNRCDFSSCQNPSSIQPHWTPYQPNRTIHQ